MTTKQQPVAVPYDQDPIVYAMVAGITLSDRQTSIHGHIPAASRHGLSKYFKRSAKYTASQPTANEHPPISADAPPSPSPASLKTGKSVANEGPYVLAEKYEFLSTCAFPAAFTGGQDPSKAFVEFKSYYPSLFERIRESNQILQRQHTDTASSTGSLDPSMAAEMAYRSSFCEPGHMVSYGALANSGSRFYYTADKRFIVKTIPYEQMRFLQDILHRYSDYVASEPHTLLIRIQALYRITWRRQVLTRYGSRRGRKHVEYLVVMSNCLSHEDALREALQGKQQQGQPVEESFDMKAWGLKHPRDTRDLRRFLSTKRDVHLTEDVKQTIKQQAQRDVAFLASLGVNDYSLLFGVLKKSTAGQDGAAPLPFTNTPVVSAPVSPLDPSTLAFSPPIPPGVDMHNGSDHLYAYPSTSSNEVYYLSLIDLLSDWQWNRKLGYYVLPGIWVYFPRYIKPSTYAKRTLMTLDRVLFPE